MRLTIAAMLLLSASAWGQTLNTLEYRGSRDFDLDQDWLVITDSVVWRVASVDNVGDSTCVHDWVEGRRTSANPGRGCLVDHRGFHCDWGDGIQPRICRKCLRKETMRENWYQHRPPPPSKTEYEILSDSLRRTK